MCTSVPGPISVNIGLRQTNSNGNYHAASGCKSKCMLIASLNVIDFCADRADCDSCMVKNLFIFKARNINLVRTAASIKIHLRERTGEEDGVIATMSVDDMQVFAHDRCLVVQVQAYTCNCFCNCCCIWCFLNDDDKCSSSCKWRLHSDSRSRSSPCALIFRSMRESNDAM